MIPIIAVVAIFSLFTSVSVRMESYQGEIPHHKILTAEDFKDGRIISGSELAEETFWLQINKRLPPYLFRLLPDATVKDNQGAHNPSHRVGRIEISTGNPLRLIQSIEIRTQADASAFRRYFTVMDVNFDGFLDFAVIDEFGAKWGRQKYWLFDPHSRRYITNSLTEELHRLTHNGIALHPETKELEVRQFPEEIPRPKVMSDRYKIVKGHLVLKEIEELKNTPNGMKLVRKKVRGRL